MSRIFRVLGAATTGLVGVLPAVAAPAAAPLACEIGYSWQPQGTTRYNAVIEIRNTGGALINGWTLRFPLPPPQQVLLFRAASTDSTSGTIVAHNIKTNGVVEAGAAVAIGYLATGQGTAMDGFSINDVPCTTTSP